MTDDQVHDVRDLSRKAGIVATTTRLRPGDPMLARLAPGARTFVAPSAYEPAAEQAAGPPRRNRPRRRGTARTVAVAKSAETAPRGDRKQAGVSGTQAPAAPKGAAVFSTRTQVGGRRGRR
jgi:hypothetical protein